MAKSAGDESFWLRVFGNSRVNGASYDGESLPVYPWSWPRGTYLQRRLREVRSENDPAIHYNVADAGRVIH